MSEELIEYFIVNEDLVDQEGNPTTMSGGKLAVQVAHVATEMAWDLREMDIHGYPPGRSFREWFMSDLHKKVILRAHESMINRIAEDANVPSYLTKDAGLTELSPNQITCIGLLPCYKSDLPKYIQRLQLYKG